MRTCRCWTRSTLPLLSAAASAARLPFGLSQIFAAYHPPGSNAGEEAAGHLEDYYIGDLVQA